jgi:hypothetical protein
MLTLIGYVSARLNSRTEAKSGLFCRSAPWDHDRVIRHDTIGGDIVTGVAVAATAALFAFFIAEVFTARRTQAESDRERDLAAAAELYRVQGELFAAWKLWEFHSREGQGPLLEKSSPRVSEIAELAAAAEGGYEALFVRMALEHDLGEDQEAVLWCLRSAFKELRRAIRTHKPLEWWRSPYIHGKTNTGFRKYQAYRTLLGLATAILTQPVPSWRQRTARAIRDSWAALGRDKNDGAVRTLEKRIQSMERIASTTHPLLERVAPRTLGDKWVVLAEHLGGTYDPEANSPETVVAAFWESLGQADRDRLVHGIGSQEHIALIANLVENGMLSADPPETQSTHGADASTPAHEQGAAGPEHPAVLAQALLKKLTRPAQGLHTQSNLTMSSGSTGD